MDATSRRGFLVAAAMGCTLAALCACGGGGGGSKKSAAEGGFLLVDVRYGRRVVETGAERLVSPLSVVETDPVTGLVIPGTLAPLSSDVNLDKLITLNLGPEYVPHVIPRNGVLVLEFNAAIDAASVSNQSVRVEHQDGTLVAVVFSVRGRELWINPVTASTVGFPPSPVNFGPDGRPRADATGFLRLITRTAQTPTTGDEVVLRATDGTELRARPDLLGDITTPIGLNPGNVVLDFIAHDELIPTNETFNGFLPDLTPPRIVREHTFDAVLDLSQDSVSASSLTDADAAFSAIAQNGQGEWAGRLLILRPGAADEEQRTVLSNTATTLLVEGTFASLPKDGDAYRLLRAEFFEPDPSHPIDDRLFDPNNPQNSANAQLANFIEVHEIDAGANAIGPRLSLRDPLPAWSQLRVRFNESMSRSSFGQWETFRVANNPDPGPRAELLTRIVLDPTQTLAAIQPVRDDPVNGTLEVVGWGPGIQSLKIELTTVPTVSFLQRELTDEELAAFLARGVRGLLDLGGRPLAFPETFFTPDRPEVHFSEPFSTDAAISSQNPPPVVAQWGVLVHRFLGKPKTGIDPITGLPGVKYRDNDYLYSPIADVNLNVNGFLSGQPVLFVTKIHDDYASPPDGNLVASPFGLSPPLASYYPPGSGTDQPHQGARFQHVYRDLDASPGSGLRGSLLDLYRVSWAPIGGNVTTDNYLDISVHAGHSFLRPSTAQNGAGATDPDSGLVMPFDYDAWLNFYSGAGPACPMVCNVTNGPNYYPLPADYVTVVPPGTSYKVSQSNVYRAPGTQNTYHPWPSFTTVFQYNNGDVPQEHIDAIRDANGLGYQCNGKNIWRDGRDRSVEGDSLLLEYRIRPQDEPTISRQNGFTFALGILITCKPHFRVFSLGDPTGGTLNPDDIAGDQRARCASGPSGGGGGGCAFGDNSRYFAVFDFVKTTSRIRSPFDPIYPDTATAADYFSAITIPTIAAQPPGTQTILEFQGANNFKGAKATEYSTDPSIANGRKHFGFRATFIGNTTTLLSPIFDLVAIPYKPTSP